MRPFASLRRRADFARLRQRGRRHASASLTLFRAPAYANDAAPILGITVGGAVGKAVVRNKLRRRIAAFFDSYFKRTPAKGRFLVIARPGAAARSYAELAGELERVLQ